MIDTKPDDYAKMLSTVEGSRSLMAGYGFETVDCPLLEPTELFVRKSGGEITSRLYSFFDAAGNRVSLRPEFTSSIIRQYIDSEDQRCDDKVLKRQYAGPVFRLGGDKDKSQVRQFTQQGAEMIGAGGIGPDSEMLKLSLEMISMAGLKNIRVKLGNTGIVRLFLSRYEINEATALYVISNLKKLNSGAETPQSLLDSALNIGLVNENKTPTPLEDLSNEVLSVIQTLMPQSISENTGRRTKEQIVSRLLRKISGGISSDEFISAISGVMKFTSIVDGEISRDRDLGAEDELGSAMEYFNSLVEGIGEVAGLNIDYYLELGNGRGLTYYTGLVFDFEAEIPDGWQPLGGGGRYDELVKALGAKCDRPAIGFALNMDAVIKAKECCS